MSVAEDRGRQSSSTAARPIRVALDLRIFGRRGIGRYNESLCRGLLERPERVSLATFRAGPIPMGQAGTQLRAPGYVLQEQVEFPLRLKGGDHDLVHFTANTAPLLRPWSAPTVVTVHDIMYLRTPGELELSPSPRQTLGRVYRFVDFYSATRRCDHIVSVSHHTASELTRRFGSGLPPISVVHSGVDPAFSRPLTAADLERLLEPFGLRPRQYLLHAGAVDPRKNTSVVIEAFQRYRARGGTCSLAVMGLSDHAAAFFQRRALSQMPVHFLPFVPNDAVVALVQGARAVIFVPTEEGFGYPLVEALAAGTPVVVSAIDVLRELSDGAAWEVAPRNAESLAAMLASFDAPNSSVESLRRRGVERARHFSIANMAAGTIAAYEAAAEAARRS
jgi:glycosyltransferase involved in cell wall biosynthesis